MMCKAYLNEAVGKKAIRYLATPIIERAIIRWLVFPMWDSQHLELAKNKVARLASISHALPLHGASGFMPGSGQAAQCGDH